MASELPSPASPPPPTESVYFAFGSNLWLQQMARRCPESRYVGLGRLAGHRWQINQRGYANVVPSPADVVEGLCYRLSAGDEAQLDVHEGLPWAYEKRRLAVQLFPGRASLAGRKIVDIIADGPDAMPPAASESAQPPLSGAGMQPQVAQVVSMLTYVSVEQVEDGRARAEYIGRINHGVDDALRLGVSPSYVARYIRPCIPAADRAAGPA